jgi:Putative zinc-finger
MNSCDDAVNILRYLDNELSGRELEALHAHMQSCPTCKVRLEEIRDDSGVEQARKLLGVAQGQRDQIERSASSGSTCDQLRVTRVLRAECLFRFDGPQFTDQECGKGTGCLCYIILYQGIANDSVTSFRSAFVAQRGNELGTDVGNH